VCCSEKIRHFFRTNMTTTTLEMVNRVALEYRAVALSFTTETGERVMTRVIYRASGTSFTDLKHKIPSIYLQAICRI